MPRRFAVLLTLLVTASLWAVPEPAADELAAARRRYLEWRQHPEQLARLRQDWQSFIALPAERREAILKLDHELHEESSSEQARLWNALERYTDWLDHLEAKDRQYVQSAAGKAARRERIQELRDREWIKRRAKAVREQWAKLKGKARADFVRQKRQELRQRHAEWVIAGRFWKELETHVPLPAHEKTLPKEVQAYVNEALLPLLDQAEKDRLRAAEGTWPAYPMLLVELADRHPPALPGPTGPRTLADLPDGVKKVLKWAKKDELPKPLRQYEGQWPGFVSAVVDYVKKRGEVFPHELWPHRYQGLLPPMQHFADKILKPALDDDEKDQLRHSEGKWPAYPQTIQELARVHHLQPPWHSIPAAKGWDPDAYRLTRDHRVRGLPEVAAAKLRDFALYDLDPNERTRLNLSPSDPGSLQRLTEAYFNHRPLELKRLRAVDRAKARKANVAP
jgi:hypothetical protein